MSDENLTKLADLVTAAMPDAKVEVTAGSPGHYSLVVHSAEFDGKRLVEKQRLVYRAIAPLMGGDNAPVHAIDSLQTLPPQ